eukprot:UN25573
MTSKAMISFSAHASGLYQALGQVVEIPISGGLSTSVGGHHEWVLFGNQTYRNAAVFVALHSEQLTIHRNSFSEWTPIGGTLRVTDSQGYILKTLDYQSAYAIYQQRLAEDR